MSAIIASVRQDAQGGFFPVLTKADTGQNFRMVILDGDPKDQAFYSQKIAQGLADSTAKRASEKGRFDRPVIEID